MTDTTRDIICHAEAILEMAAEKVKEKDQDAWVFIMAAMYKLELAKERAEDLE